MIRIDLLIGGRSHAVQCAESDVDHVRALAARIDGFAAQAGQLVGTATESRQWLYTALLLADRLAEAEAEAAGVAARGAEANAPSAPDDPHAEALAERAEALADALEKRVGRA